MSSSSLIQPRKRASGLVLSLNRLLDVFLRWTLTLAHLCLDVWTNLATAVASVKDHFSAIEIVSIDCVQRELSSLRPFPKHVALVAEDDGRDLLPSLSGVAECVRWLVLAGVKDLTLYDRSGKIKTEQDSLLK